MTGTGWLLLIGGGLLAYYLISKSGATYSANPLQNILSGPPYPAPAGMKWDRGIGGGGPWTLIPVGASS